MTTHMTREDFQSFRHGINTYIETGLWQGETLATAATVFKCVYGIEKSPHWAAVTKKHVPTAKILVGDSGEVLPKLCKQLLEPVFFYLDAHWTLFRDHPVPYSEAPLWAELAAIRDRKMPDVVIVDDVHAFGVVRDDAPEWRTITCESISDFMDCPGRRVGRGWPPKDCYLLKLRGDE